MYFPVSDKQYFDYCRRLQAAIRTASREDLPRLSPSVALATAQGRSLTRIFASACVQQDYHTRYLLLNDRIDEAVRKFS